MLKYPSFRLKFCDVTSFNRKSGYLALKVASEHLAPMQVSHKIGN